MKQEVEYIPTIKEATIDELVDELGLRHTGIVCVAVRDVPNRDGCDSSATHIVYRGGWITAMGLIEYAHRYSQQKLGPAPVNEEDD